MEMASNDQVQAYKLEVVEAQIEDVKLHDNENLLSFATDYRVTFKKCLKKIMHLPFLQKNWTKSNFYELLDGMHIQTKIFIKRA